MTRDIGGTAPWLAGAGLEKAAASRQGVSVQEVAVAVTAGDFDDDLDVARVAEPGEFVLGHVGGAAGVGAVVVAVAGLATASLAGGAGGANDGFAGELGAAAEAGAAGVVEGQGSGGSGRGMVGGLRDHDDGCSLECVAGTLFRNATGGGGERFPFKKGILKKKVAER